jgi:hypothetical protein
MACPTHKLFLCLLYLLCLLNFLFFFCLLNFLCFPCLLNLLYFLSLLRFTRTPVARTLTGV